MKNEPRCHACKWGLSFAEEDGRWIARCWNPNCSVDEIGEKRRIRAASYLSPPDFQRLDLACYPIYRAYGAAYLVGSVLTRPDFRDIDLRYILFDEEYDRMFPGEDADSPRKLCLLNVALSRMIADSAQLAWPVDFQFQRMTEANAEFDGMRNPMGTRWAYEAV